MQNLSLTFDKSIVIAKIKANRTLHERSYKEALADFKIRAENMLGKQLAKVTYGNTDSVAVYVTSPINKLAEYDQAIAMLEQCQEASISLDTSSYKCFMLNQWDWAAQVFDNHMSYKRSD